MIEVGVKVQTRENLLDPQGIAVQKSLKEQGLAISDVRVGKYILLRIMVEQDNEALEIAKKVAKELLINPIAEDFEVEIRK